MRAILGVCAARQERSKKEETREEKSRDEGRREWKGGEKFGKQIWVTTNEYRTARPSMPLCTATGKLGSVRPISLSRG